jgi:hypothetical protein
MGGERAPRRTPQSRGERSLEVARGCEAALAEGRVEQVAGHGGARIRPRLTARRGAA